MEKFWDPLNKAAIMVTLFTGIPAFLVFMGLPFFAAVLLGVLSISSLTFAFIRGRVLTDQISRIQRLHEQDSELMKRVNSLILGFDETREENKIELRNVMSDSLENLKKYAEALCKTNVRVSLFTLEDGIKATALFSSTPDRNRKIVFDLKTSSVLGSVLQGSSSGATVHLDSSGDFYRLRPATRIEYQTIAAFPIYSSINRSSQNQTWAGFLSVDFRRKTNLPSDLKLKLIKYTHLYFLILHSVGMSVTKEIAEATVDRKLSASSSQDVVT